MDFRFANQGSVTLLEPVTDAAWQWINENVAVERNQMWWGRSLVIEPRYAAPILRGIRADGLEVV